MDGTAALMVPMVLVLVLARLRRGRRIEEASRGGDPEDQIEQDQRERDRPGALLDETDHRAPPLRPRSSATASGLSQALGPTARPTSLPSLPIRNVVGKPRTMKEPDTS